MNTVLLGKKDYQMRTNNTQATYNKYLEIIMSNENKERVIDVTTSVQNNTGYWRVVKVDLEDGTEFKNEELFESREEADASCEKRQQEWKEHAWDNREYLSMEYQVRFVSMEEVAEEKRQRLEKWHNYVRKTFVEPIVPTTFKSCCQKLVSTMQQKVDKLSKKDISKMRHDRKHLYSPWLTYGGGAKLWAYIQFESGNQKVSLWGMYTKDSLFGSIIQRIEIFDCIADFKAWIEDSNQAVDILEKRMLDALERNINGDELPQ